ncbi:hypothetical protein J6590_062874 [Homalodisca vitripennis]|nr:hypothetical protein J6590_062874 [Homalodisca vitripennis]
MKDMEQVSTSESSSPEYPSTTRPLIPCLLKGIVEDRVKKDEWGKVVDDLLTELNKKRRGNLTGKLEEGAVLPSSPALSLACSEKFVATSRNGSDVMLKDEGYGASFDI